MAKCMLMDNLPYGDFEMDFYDGTRLINSIDKRELCIRLFTGEVHTINTAIGEKLTIKSTLLPIFKSLQECLKMCLEIEKSAESSFLKGKKIKFPIIVRHSQTKPSTFMNVNSNLQSSFPTYIEQKPSRLSTLSSFCPSSSLIQERPLPRELHKVNEMSIIHSGMMSYSTTNKDSQTSIRSESKSQKSSSDDISEGMNKKNQPLSYNTSRSMTLLPHTSSVSLPNIIITLDIRKTCFLNGIGWCMQAENNDLLVLFIDGIEFIIDHLSRSLHLIHNRDIKRYAIDTTLPETLKKKLVYIPEFMKLLGITL
jgi:hypothetical protein